MENCPALQDLEACLLNSSEPIAKRTHAAFFLRTLGTGEAVEVICRAVVDSSDSPLLRHELCYILGQMQNSSACPTLSAILSDCADDVMVRHEAGEALGAIGDEGSFEILEKFCDDPAIEVSETCKLALDLIRWKRDQAAAAAAGEAAPAAGEEGELDRNPYLSVDPAPAEAAAETVAGLRAKLLDPSLGLFARYRAMFSLRNRGTEEAVLALADGLGDPSALFRHEVAYVLGQVQHPASVPALCAALEKQVGGTDGPPRGGRGARGHRGAQLAGAAGVSG
ncbi:unnamed protein product [Heterosigma akashiwo]